MLGAARPFAGGALMIRTMVSLEPLTVRNGSYPLLFQTGETANGRALVDGQHPHDAVMELGMQYVRPVGERGLVTLYYAPVGDAALGPVAFPHRASAMELPQAALGHHWQDATHIASNVATAGFNYGKWRIEASGFRGREPNENRWNIDMGRMDSWSSRLSYQPGANWLLQASAGRIESPEPSHPGDLVRSTASVQYTRPASGGTGWSSTVMWGRNDAIGGQVLNSVLAETLFPLTRDDLLTGRFEWSDRDELFPDDAHDEDHGANAFRVASYTAGYSRELPAVAALRTALGFNLTTYGIAEGLKPFYGNRPMAASVFVRFRLWSNEP
jgi:hypothetical protein